MRLHAALAGALLAFGSLSCGPQCTLPALGSGASVKPGGAATCCLSYPPQPFDARVQFLVDDSGSMGGFARSLPRLFLWAEQGLSQVQGRMLRLASRRSCYFSQRQGMHGCVEGALPAGGFQAAGDTSLHDAVAGAADYDLTLILTDGVAATGVGGSGDCASGVDAACVARALQRAIAPRPGEPQGSTAGIWVVPIVALFDGRLYTEELIAPGDFNPAAAMEAVQSETATTARIASPGLDNNNRLVYNYQGPRLLLALVIARQAQAGRALVQGLMVRSQFAQIQTLAGPKSFQQGVAVLNPIEVYPGYVPGWEVTATRIEQQKGSRQVCGTLSQTWSADPPELRLACVGSENQAILRAATRPSASASECFALEVLPQMRTTVAERPAQPDVLRGQQTADGSVLLKVACNEGWGLPCGPNAHRIEWTAHPQWAETAACLARENCDSTAARSLRAISTARVSAQPHRVYGLLETVLNFYQQSSGSAPGLTVASIGICRGR